MITKTRKTGRLLLTIALVTPITLTGSGCRYLEPYAIGTPTSFVFVLVDVSGTTSDARKAYLDDLKNIIEQLQSGDILWADQITGNSLATSRIPLKLDLPPFDFLSNNRDQYDKQVVAQKKKALGEATLLISGDTHRTAILDSILVAQKVFHTPEALRASHRILVLLSDMREDSNRYVFDREKLTTSRTERIIASERVNHGIADLRGVEVYVAGATADPTEDPEQVQQIQAFWQAYFRAAGTVLPDQRYAASLLDFALPR